MIVSKAKINQAANNGLTPLFIAILNGRFNIVNTLIEAGADINQVDNDGDSPLIVAVQHEKSDILQVLITAGADVQHVNKKRKSALMFASASGFLDIVQILIASKAKINQTDGTGSDSLLFAIQNGLLYIVKALIEAGADMKHADNDGDSRLIVAALNGKSALLPVLINSGADLHQVNNKGQNALICACDKGFLDIVQILLIAGINVHHTDQEGHSALIYASVNGHPDVIQALIASKAKINQTNHAGHGPLFYAAQEGRSDVVNILINGGADVNRMGKSGSFPLKAACAGGDLSVLDSLLKANADINKMNKNGYSALSSAVEAEKSEVIKVLINANANIDLLNKSGYTPLTVAKLNYIKEAEEILIEAGADNRYATAFINTKFLAHCWGLKGKSTLNHKDGTRISYEVEGFNEEYTIPKITQSVSEFLDNEIGKDVLSEQTILIIKDTFENAHPLKKLTQDEIEARMDQNIPTFFSVSSATHTIGIILTGTQIIFCNRGGGLGVKEALFRRGSTEFYTAGPEKLKALIPIILDSDTALLKLHKIVKKNPAYILDDFYSQKNQYAGNCTWASPKASFLALIYALDENRKIDKKKSLNVAKCLYKKFTLKQRITVLSEYLETTPIDSLSSSRKLLVKIYKKLIKKTSPAYLAAKSIEIDPRAGEVSTQLKALIKRIASTRMRSRCIPL